MLKIRKAYIAVLAVFVLAASGCEYKELENIMIVSGITVDGEKGKLISGIECLDSPAGNEIKPQTQIIRSQGESLYDLLKKADILSEKELFFNHVQMIIVSPEIAKQGITWLLNEVLQYDDLRLSVPVVIVKDSEAFDILKAGEGSGDEAAFFRVKRKLYDVFHKEYSLDGSVYKIYRAIDNEGIACLIPCMSVEEQSEDTQKTDGKSGDTASQNGSNEEKPKVCVPYGCAVFSGDKLTGYMNLDELLIAAAARGMNVNGKFPIIIDEENIINTVITKSKGNVKAQKNDDKIKAKINLEFDLRIIEGIDEISIKSEEDIKKAEQMAEKQIKDMVLAILERDKSELKADVFGIGSKIAVSNAELWEQIKKQKEYLENVECDVKVKVKLAQNNLFFNN